MLDLLHQAAEHRRSLHNPRIEAYRLAPLEDSHRGWLGRFVRGELEDLLAALRNGEDDEDWLNRESRAQVPVRGPVSYIPCGLAGDHLSPSLRPAASRLKESHLDFPAWHITFRHHEVMNPSSPEKIRLLGARLRLDPTMSVLDVGCGTCGPAVILAAEYGSRVTAVDSHQPFLEQGRERAARAGVSQLITFVHGDGAEFAQRAAEHDLAMCLGATWIFGGVLDTLRTLRRLVPVGGHVAVGDLYRPQGSPRSAEGPEQTLSELLETMRSAGLAPVTLITASTDDWDTYSSLKWLSIEDWLEENPDHPEASRFRKRSTESDLQEQTLGWAIIAGRRAPDLDHEEGD